MSETGSKISLIIFCAFMLVSLFSTFVLAEPLEVKGYVNDYAQLLSPQEEQEISSILDSLKKQGLAEFSILTISTLEGIPIEKYAFDVAQGTLGSKEKNNGLLLLISLEDRAYRFEVGRGLESVLNDAKVGRIGREILVPAFKNKNYNKGIKESVGAIYLILGGDGKLSSSYSTVVDFSKEENKLNDLFYYLFLFLIFIFFITGKKGSKRRLIGAMLLATMLRGGRGGNRGGGGFGGGGFGGGGAGGKW